MVVIGFDSNCLIRIPVRFDLRTQSIQGIGKSDEELVLKEVGVHI